MSRVLRRPMFRGGYVDSEGTGITSGLTEPRQGYANGPTDEGVQQNEYSPLVQDILGLKDFLKLKGASAVDTFFNVPVNKISEYVTGYNPGLSAVRQMQEKGDPLFAKYDPDKAYFFTTPTEARKGTIRENIEYKKGKEKKTVTPSPFISTEKEDVTQKYTLPTLEQDVDLYSKLLLDRAGPDKDEYTRQKYLTLAKFGLNLLKPTPAGIKPSLLSSAAAAAEKPLEEYANISMQQSKEDRALKQLAAQLAFQKNMPGNIAKGIQDLMRVNPKMTVEEATDIVTTGKNKAALEKEKFNEIIQKQKDIEDLATKDPSIKKLLKVDPSFSNTYARIAVEQGLYGHELKGLASDYSVYQPGAIYYAPDKKTGELIPHKYIKGKFYSIREPEFKLKGI